MEENNFFEFDPTKIVGSPGEEKKTPEVAEEKLNLFADKIFDEDTEIKTKEIKNTDENTPTPEEIKKDESSQQSVFSVVLGQDLKERGVISSFDEEEIKKIALEQGEDAALIKMFEAQTEAINNEIKSTYDSNYQEYLTMVQGGVPKEEAAGISQLENYQQSLSSIDLKSEDNLEDRKALLTLNYRLTTKWSDSKINQYIEKLVDEGEDLNEVDEALENLNVYIDSEKKSMLDLAESTKKQAQLDQEKMINDYKSYVDKTDEYFSGEKISKDMKSKIEKAILDPVKLSNGAVTNKIWAKRAENPISFDSKIAYLEEIGFFDDKPLDKFIKKAETKSTTKLADYLSDNKGRDFLKSMDKSFKADESKKVDFFDF